MPARPPAVARVLERIVGTVRRHDLIHPSDHVLLAVSGGPDSLCLLHALVRLRDLFRVRLSVGHVDHGMDPDAGEAARAVAARAARLGLPFVGRRLEGRPPRGVSPEAWMREGRYRALEEARREAGADRVATGHTADDQAETVLLAAIRGGSLEALSGIPPIRDRIIRPLLDVEREETEAFCRALRLRPRRDPTNEDRSYLRNAVRLDVLPAMARATGRDARPPLRRLAEVVRSDAAFLDDAAARQARRVVRRERGGSAVRLLIDPLVGLPYPLASRVVAGALQTVGPPGGVSRVHVDAVLDLAAGRPGRRADLPGLSAARERTFVRIAPSPGG